MDLHAIRLEVPSDGNIIVGHSHFIKTVEDIYEAIVNTVPQMKFGIAFNEASGACLTRVDGNDDELKSPSAMRPPLPPGTCSSWRCAAGFRSTSRTGFLKHPKFAAFFARLPILWK
jgi:Adenosine specific kinase